MKLVLAVLAMCLCLAGCQVAKPRQEASFDYSDYIVYSLRSDVPDVKWPSMFDFDRRETSLSFSLAWDLARSKAWDSETKHHTGVPGSYLGVSIPFDDEILLDYELWENVVRRVEFLPLDVELDDSADPCPPLFYYWDLLAW